MSSVDSAEIREAAFKRFLEEEGRKKREELVKKQEEERIQEAKEKAIREQLILLKAQEEEIRLRAERAVLEEEARALASKKEEALQKELERLRNRTPLEVLADELAELKAGLASVSASLCKREWVLTKEKCVKAWPLLLKWKVKSGEVLSHRSAYINYERNILSNEYFAGKIGGTFAEFCKPAQTEAELMKVKDTMALLEAQHLVHKNHHEALEKTINECKNFAHLWTRLYSTFDATGSDASNEARYMTFLNEKRHRGFAHILKDRPFREFMTERETHRIKAQQYEMATKELEIIGPLYKAETERWNKSSDKDTITKKHDGIHALYVFGQRLKDTLEKLNKLEEELELLESEISTIVGGETDIEKVFNQAIQIMRKLRMY